MIVFYFLVGIMPLSEHRIWGRMLGNLTIFKYVGIAAVVYAILHAFSKGLMPEYFRTRQARLFVVFCMIAAESHFTKSFSTNFGVSPLFSYISFLLLFFVTVTVVDSVHRLRIVMLTAVGAVAFASLYMIREWQEYHNVYEGFRPGWVVGDPNYFTISALLTIPFALYLMLGSKQRWERWLCAGCLGVTLVAVTLGASRGGFLGLVVSFIFVVWHSRQRLRNLVVAGGLVLPLFLLMPISPLMRLLHPNNGDTIAQQARTSLWQAGLHMMESYPVTGVGLGNFKPLVPEYSDLPTPPDYIAHNAYIEIGSEMGVPALLIFIGILISSFETLNSIRKLAPRPGLYFVREAALSLQAGLLGSAVAIIFVSGQYQKMLWLIIFLSMCMSAIARQHLRFLNEDKLKS